jgi:branched-chain amino acid transport system permease protein
MRSPFTWVDDTGLGRSAYPRTLLGSVLLPLVLAVVALVCSVVFPGTETTLLSLGISAIFVVGYQIFVGSTGIVSFGHMAFAAIGGYTAAILTTPVAIKGISLPDIPFGLAGIELPLIPALLLGGLAAAIVAVVSGIGLMRLTGAAAGVSTLALLLIVLEALRNAEAFTRGTQTFYGVPNNVSVIVVYGTLAVAALVAVAYKFSGFGLRARAGRDAPLAAETTGIPILRGRLISWTISAFVMGVGGALYVHQLTAFSPSTFGIAFIIPIVVMAVLGGMNSAAGAILGAVLLTVWLEIMRNVESGSLFGLALPEIQGISQLTVGVGLIVILRLRPRGILDNLEPQLRRVRELLPRRG